MDQVELEPLVHREGPEDRVVDDFCSAKLFTRADGGGVEALEIASSRLENGREIELAGRDDVFRRLASLGKVAEVDQYEGGDAPLEWRRSGRERLPLLEAPFETFRRAEECPLQVFDHFGDGPLIGLTADPTFVAAAARGVFNDCEAPAQIFIHLL